jgi:parvulin-like peptidyl-prolyl isomerase
MGLTPEQFQRRVREQSLAEAVIDRELKSTITITDAEVQEFHRSGTDFNVRAMQADLDRLAADPASKLADIATLRTRIDAVRSNNLSRLEQPEKVRLLHIFFATRERNAETELSAEQKKIKRQELEKLRARAVAGEDFAKLVMAFSEDRGLAETKGEYTFSRYDRFSPEFVAASFSLQPGAISDVVSTSFGMHLIKLLEKIPAQKADFDKVAKDLREVLLQQSLQKALPEYFARLKKEVGVEIIEPKYRIDLSGKAPLY